MVLDFATPCERQRAACGVFIQEVAQLLSGDLNAAWDLGSV